MITSPKRSVSTWFFFAIMTAGIFIWATIQNNREIAQRRLIQPIQTVGTLVSSRCTTFIRGAARVPKPEAVLTYRYVTIGLNPTEHVLVTTHWFDTLDDCATFEKTISNVATIWYEKEHPEKASLYKTESDSWGFLYGLILAAFFVLLGVYDQKSINEAKSKAQKEKRALNRSNRKRHS